MQIVRTVEELIALGTLHDDALVLNPNVQIDLQAKLEIPFALKFKTNSSIQSTLQNCGISFLGTRPGIVAGEGVDALVFNGIELKSSNSMLFSMRPKTCKSISIIRCRLDAPGLGYVNTGALNLIENVVVGKPKPLNFSGTTSLTILQNTNVPDWTWLKVNGDCELNTILVGQDLTLDVGDPKNLAHLSRCVLRFEDANFKVCYFDGNAYHTKMPTNKIVC